MSAHQQWLPVMRHIYTGASLGDLEGGVPTGVTGSGGARKAASKRAGKKFTVTQLKRRKEKFAMITAYDFPSAEAATKVGADMILVGDSLGMVV
jgi:hypothetical protein